VETTTPLEDSWRLADLFEDDDTFERARSEFATAHLPLLDRYRGRLAESAAVLADALEADAAALERLYRLHAYANMRADEDLRRPAGQAMRQQVELLGTEVSKRRAFLRPEILSAQPSLIEAWIREEPRLGDYAHYLRDLMRQRAHVLSPDEERIVAETGLLRGDAAALYGILTNTELPRPELALSTGERVRLTPVAFQRHRTTTVRADRLAMFPLFFRAYADFRDSLAQNLYAAIKGHLFTARVRRYDSCLGAALDADNVPERVYRNLIEQVHRRLPTLHRYFRLRARALGLERLEYTDLHCHLSSAPARRYSVPEARRLVVEGLRPLGPDYVEALEQAFDARWVDWHPATGKRAGAYASGWAYRVHPYVLMNFNEDYESVLTAAHEMGHAMHSHFSNASQPFVNANYSIFVAEVASTFNEALLLGKMFEEARTAEERLFLAGSYLDGLRGTLFRQTMFAEFELEIHERAERGEVLTGERLSEIYLRLLRLYHGHDEGVVHVAEEYAVEWAAIPHMYYDFYVYQYATGIVAAAALARAVSAGQAGARDRYLAFLRSGGSDYPLEILRRAGVDLERPAPYDDAFAAIESRLDELERWLGPGTPPAV
jgi:oligoendopeptidase F